MRKKVLIVFGTRPEAIKMAPLVEEFFSRDTFVTKVCVTAQHREMLDQVLSIFKIKPDYDLNLMTPGQDLTDVTSRVLIGMRSVLAEYNPDLVFVHGDTTTGFVSALASYYRQIPVAHIEAGLRTNNIYSPFPEEINRQLIGRIARYHFCPTECSKESLLKENVKEEAIHVTGNTVIDALNIVVQDIHNNKEKKLRICSTLKDKGYKISDKKIILVTGHRRENIGRGLMNICAALKSIAMQNSDVEIVYPVHLNPNVQKHVHEMLSKIKNIYLIEPLEYEEFVFLMDKSYFILTDSGGVQEEAPSLGKPVLVMRDATERPEALAAGTVKLVGTNTALIIEETNKLLNNDSEYRRMSEAHNPYGDGKACKRIANTIAEIFANR
jgi:UDP-N-acetylglucosamine 2-epimerase (non-hydrolysing)